MNPSTSLGTRSNVGMAKPSPPVRQAGNIGSLLMIRGVCRRKVPSGGAQVKSKCRCRDKIMPIPGKVMFKDDQLVKVRLQATHPLAKPVLACLSRILAEF